MDCKFLPISRWEHQWIGPHKVIVADTVCKKQQGAKGVNPLDAIILFPRIKEGNFFTTIGCLVDLEIMPLGKNNQVLDIWTEPPNKLKVGPFPRGTNKILEAPKGWCRKFDIKPGDNLYFLSLGQV